MEFWEKFLEEYKSHGAHFHGEGDPPDFLLEVRPHPESQDWIYSYRPPGHSRDNETKNMMCRELLEELKTSHKKT